MTLKKKIQQEMDNYTLLTDLGRLYNGPSADLQRMAKATCRIPMAR